MPKPSLRGNGSEANQGQPSGSGLLPASPSARNDGRGHGLRGRPHRTPRTIESSSARLGMARRPRPASGDGLDRPRGFFDDLADLRLADDQRRRQNSACRRSCAGEDRNRGKRDRSRRTLASQGRRGLAPRSIAALSPALRISRTLGSPFKLCTASPQRGSNCSARANRFFFFVEVERGETGGTSQRVARTGIAVQKFDPVIRAIHEGFVNRLGRTITPPIGTVPEVTPVAKVIMSGSTP